jgi:hypothetical protein
MVPEGAVVVFDASHGVNPDTNPETRVAFPIRFMSEANTSLSAEAVLPTCHETLLCSYGRLTTSCTKNIRSKRYLLLVFLWSFSVILWHFAHMIILSAAVRLYAILGVI